MDLRSSLLSPSEKHVEVVRRRAVRYYRLVSFSYWLGLASVLVHPLLWSGLGARLTWNVLKAPRVMHLVRLPDSLWHWEEYRALRLGRPLALVKKARPAEKREAALGHILVPVRGIRPRGQSGRQEAALGAPTPTTSG